MNDWNLEIYLFQLESKRVDFKKELKRNISPKELIKKAENIINCKILRKERNHNSLVSFEKYERPREF